MICLCDYRRRGSSSRETGQRTPNSGVVPAVVDDGVVPVVSVEMRKLRKIGENHRAAEWRPLL
jgi:hypothetical protein